MVSALHHPKAGMAFHPYRQQGTSGHMGVHKHQGHLSMQATKSASSFDGIQQ